MLNTIQHWIGGERESRLGNVYLGHLSPTLLKMIEHVSADCGFYCITFWSNCKLCYSFGCHENNTLSNNLTLQISCFLTSTEFYYHFWNIKNFFVHKQFICRPCCYDHFRSIRWRYKCFQNVSSFALTHSIQEYEFFIEYDRNEILKIYVFKVHKRKWKSTVGKPL